MVMMFGLLAFAVDIGYIALVRTELQSSADSAAMAATWDLLNDRTLTPTVTTDATLARARATAEQYAHLNLVGKVAPGLTTDDVEFGRLDVTAGNNAVMNFTDPSLFNATRVRVRRQGDLNDEVPTFFGRVLGKNSSPSQAQAMAVFLDNFRGFKPPSSGNENIGVLPFALDELTWANLKNGITPDNWTWNEETGQITSGPDGVHEGNLYPQGTESPGNRGTVDIGSSNNSTADLSRQIREGVSLEDLVQLDGKLELGADGTLELNGDTGISAGVKDDLASVMGEPRIIPIFRDVSGPGNNAQYTIVAFAGVRILEVVLTGKMSGKRVIIQPARVEVIGGIPGGDDGWYSDFLHSPVWLVR
jgi:hypothetical protein